MKNLLFIAVLLIGCRPEDKVVYPIYRYETKIDIPDSLREKQAEWIKETVRATDQHLGAGDYEDPEDVIEEVTETSEKLFSKQIEGLNITYSPDQWSIFVPYSQLNEKQKEIFNKLKNF